MTVAFSNDELYKAIRIRAAQSGTQIRDIVEEALAQWLTAHEDAEDIRATADATAEAGNDIDADAYFQKLVAEERVQYGDEPQR